MKQKNADLVESLHQFVSVWKLIGKPFPKVDLSDRSGLAIAWPDTHFPFYNAVFLTEPLSDAQVFQTRVREAAEYMRARQNGGLFVVCLDNLNGMARENLSTILDQAKFVQTFPMTGMAGDILPMEAPGIRQFDSNEYATTQRYRTSCNSIVFHTMCRSTGVARC